jgi:hypothetical protein
MMNNILKNKPHSFVREYAKTILLVFLLGFEINGQVNAATIAITQGNLFSSSYAIGGMGSGRGIGISVSSSFKISSLGINLSVLPSATSGKYKFEIYDSTDGHTVGSSLYNKEFTLSEGNGWRDIAFNFSFTAGSSYVINFARTDGASLNGLGTMYSWEPSSHFNYGSFSTVEGFEASLPNPENPLSVHFRMDGQLAPCIPIANNPCYQEIKAEIAAIAKEKNIPPVIIQAIAFKESGWLHFDTQQHTLDYCVANVGLPLVKYSRACEKDGRVGIGMMQVTVFPNDSNFNQLSSDWKYNLRAGVDKLWSKWQTQRTEAPNDTGLDIDPTVIENWYYPVMWYNGENARAWDYVKSAFQYSPQNHRKIC